MFHSNIEEYLYRQWRAYTFPRALMWTVGSYGYLAYTTLMFFKTFPNIEHLGFKHPNIKLLGGFWSAFYMLRPFFWLYIHIRLLKFSYSMASRWWRGKTEEHYSWYYDNLYPDFIVDPDENRYINFRYSDSSVSPE